MIRSSRRFPESAFRVAPNSRLACAAALLLLLGTALPVPAQETRLKKLIEALQPEPGGAVTAPTLDGEVPTSKEPPAPAPIPEDLDPLKDEETVGVGRGASDVSVEKGTNGTVSVIARQAAVTEVLEMIAQTEKFNLVMSTNVAKEISITLKNVPVERALDAVVQIAGLTWIRRDDIILVTDLQGGEGIAPQVQNRELRVFELDYAAVENVETGVQQLLSPVGTVSVHQTLETDIRQTKNLIVVEDLPEYVLRIEQYITQVDQQPRQVMIEARVLEVKLTDNYAHGVNLLQKIAAGQGSTLTLSTKGFANVAAGQALLFTLTSDNVADAIEMIENTLDSKTLANPRILAVNGQEAQIQVGGQLGFRVLTTTQTSTLEQVQFLNTGVILKITPFITRDGQILMRVHPEVSTGEINEQGLPEAQTTTVDTQVVLPDGQGMVIGGLIRETYADRQSKVPVLGDIRWVGRLFQRRGVDRDRTEVIIALIPRIVPFDCQTAERDREELARTDAPIFRDDMVRNYRPEEPRVYDAVENPRYWRNLIPWNRRMNPKPQITKTPYPTDPASRACLDESGTGEFCSPNEEGSIYIPEATMPEEMEIPIENSPSTDEIDLVPMNTPPAPEPLAPPSTLPPPPPANSTLLPPEKTVGQSNAPAMRPRPTEAMLTAQAWADSISATPEVKMEPSPPPPSNTKVGWKARKVPASRDQSAKKTGAKVPKAN